MDQFQKEQNDVFKYLLDIYKQQWLTEDCFHLDSGRQHGIELFITPTCNQKCKYCYLVKNGDKLYPQEYNKSDIILKNLNAVYTYLLENNLYIPKLDFFSGEIWGSELGNKVFNITLSYLQRGMHVKDILIPSNMSFLNSPELREKIQSYKDKFNEYGTYLRFSASVDGQILEEETRPYKNDVLNQKHIKENGFYDNMFLMCTHNGWGMHPMIAAEGIEKQKENYVWWHDQFKKYAIHDIYNWNNYIMFLEVRNDDWTDEKITSYIDWLNFAVDYDYEQLWKDYPLDFLYSNLIKWEPKDGEKIYYKDGSEYTPTKLHIQDNYVHYALAKQSQNNQIQCSMGRSLCLRLGDLAVMPCHRTAYDKLLYGKLISDGHTITGIEALNPGLMFTLVFQGKPSLFHCADCPIADFCIRGCLGSQYEHSQELLYPIDCVCEFDFARFIFLHHKIHKFIKEHHLDEIYSELKLFNIDKAYKQIQDKRPEEIEKWEPIIENII